MMILGEKRGVKERSENVSSPHPACGSGRGGGVYVPLGTGVQRAGVTTSSCPRKNTDHMRVCLPTSNWATAHGTRTCPYEEGGHNIKENPWPNSSQRHAGCTQSVPTGLFDIRAPSATFKGGSVSDFVSETLEEPMFALKRLASY